MKKLTIFTPTYNRIKLLPRLYESLKAQSSKEFIWLIIDDGSTDGTNELVKEWQKENFIEIQYEFKQNGGMHTAHNLAYDKIKTELNVCIDSDDYMPFDAIEIIVNKWKVNDNQNIAGLIGLDALQNGEIVGTSMPHNLETSTLHELYSQYKVKGDKKIVLRTDIVNKYPRYPEFENERLVPLGILYLMIGQSYEFLLVNKPLCTVEYQADGSSKTILQQYRKSPRGFGYARLVKLKYSTDWLAKFKDSLHLISSAFFLRDIKLPFKSPYPILSFLLLPGGLLLNLYIRWKTKP
ncbi:glycosyltransferase family 2 protein [Salegentibacter sp. BDJ18]|uniref:glycosyltransferase family A protein n=1 Tax=Salegentibacter sp. BDJ18 TaxID=2816376 RepID=UPI001AAFC3C4|nr:glycosyltransferase family A protein [Salegentibacter sp. BDJ18]MBO2544811.1 glycosyltransferase family 2 protein [Salegentibacter sp. BDJ18]